MRKSTVFAPMGLALGLGLAWVSIIGQETNRQPSSPPPTASASADKNPDKSKGKSNTAPAKAAAVGDSQAPPRKASTADDNPFPEEVSKQAAAEAKAAAAAPNAPASAKRAGDSSSLDNTGNFGVDDPARKKLKLHSPDGTVDVYDPKRAAEDVKVGKFYLQTGYYKGAYDRLKDATSFDHENVEAVFWLAEAARKMNFAQEAAANYRLYLAAAPDGPNAKTAKKAFAELPASAKP